jgi:hypothetical protein
MIGSFSVEGHVMEASGRRRCVIPPGADECFHPLFIRIALEVSSDV